MKINALLVCLLLAVTQLFAQNYSGDSWSDVRSQGSGTLACIYYPTPGLVYEENGKVKVELANKNQRPMPSEVIVTYKDGSKQRFYLPLRLMRGSRSLLTIFKLQS